jgi:hypothetical protein
MNLVSHLLLLLLEVIEQGLGGNISSVNYLSGLLDNILGTA